MYDFYVFWPSNLCYYQDNRLQILNCTQDSTFRAVKAPIAAKEELFDVEEDVVDGHLHFKTKVLPSCLMEIVKNSL